MSTPASSPSKQPSKQPIFSYARVPLADAADTYQRVDLAQAVESDARRALAFSSTSRRLLLENHPAITKVYADELKRNLRSMAARSQIIDCTTNMGQNIPAAGLNATAPKLAFGHTSRADAEGGMPRAAAKSLPQQLTIRNGDDNSNNENAFRPGSRAHDVFIGSLFPADSDTVDPQDVVPQPPSPTAEDAYDCDRSLKISTFSGMEFQWDDFLSFDHHDR